MDCCSSLKARIFIQFHMLVHVNFTSAKIKSTMPNENVLQKIFRKKVDGTTNINIFNLKTSKYYSGERV